MTKQNEYARGYQDAMRELAEILERDGIDAMVLLAVNANTSALLAICSQLERLADIVEDRTS